MHVIIQEYNFLKATVKRITEYSNKFESSK